MVAPMETGSTMPHIAEAPRTAIAQPQTVMAAQPAETPQVSDRTLRGRVSAKLEQAPSGVEMAAQVRADKA